MVAEFRAFLLKTNALALAVGVILGVAMGSVVTSLVKDILMPPIGLVMGKVDFANLYLNLSGGNYPNLKTAQEAGAVTVNYGVFINTVISFVIVALVVFLIGRMFMKEAPAPAAPARKDCPRCAESILAAARRCPHCTAEL